MHWRAFVIPALLAAILAAGCRTGASESLAPTVSDTEVATLIVESAAFADGSPIPVEHATPAAGGRNASIPLSWSKGPEGTASFAIEVIDLYRPANEWVHWLVIDIPPNVTELRNAASGSAIPGGARELANGFGTRGWGGPQPPRGTGVHEYQVTVYALDADSLALDDGASLGQFRRALDGHVLASGTLTGTFER